jgi:hypothetical protein
LIVVSGIDAPSVVDGGRLGARRRWRVARAEPTGEAWPERPGTEGAKSGRDVVWLSAAQPPRTSRRDCPRNL